jgi:hypothetical protein
MAIELIYRLDVLADHLINEGKHYKKGVKELKRELREC